MAETGLALGRLVSVGVHDKLHATRLAGTILARTLLATVAPLEVAAAEDSLIVEAHGDGSSGTCC